MKGPRILLADDHVMLLDALAKLLADEWDVVGRVSDGRDVAAAAEQLRPELIVLDIAMPPVSGLDVGRQIKQVLPQIKLVFMTMNDDPELAAEAFRAGASGYVLKRSAATELSTAIREVMKGRSYVPSFLTRDIMSALLADPRRPQSRELSPRQQQVLRRLASGDSMKEVAAALNVSPRTVAFHKYQMMTQLQIKSTAELIQYAVKHKVV
jgi:DNA-binding NarL/FixJ family response regulator